MKSAEYERADHQPHRGPVNRPLPSHEELKRACGKTAAVVLATDFSTTPLTVQFENDAREPVTCGKVDKGKAGIPRPLQSFEGKAATSIAVEAALACGFASVTVVAGGNDSERATLERTVRAEVRCVDNAVRFAPLRCRQGIPRNHPRSRVRPLRHSQRRARLRNARARYGT